MESKVDKSKSFDLPSLPRHHLPRINYVKWLHDRLSSERKVIVVKGPDGSGKTTLISEFIHSYSDQCLSFFIGSDVWSSSPHLFLYEMCDQLAKTLGDSSQTLEQNIGNKQLTQYFTTLYHRLSKLARQKKVSYFFVIDGLDMLEKSSTEDSIIDLLPFDPPTGIFLLASSTNEFEIPFNHETYSIQNFSEPETEHYLSDLNITKEKIKVIFRSCDGMPGYLSELRREIESGNSIDEVLLNLPNGIKNLLERKWRIFINSCNDLSIEVLSILSFSEINLDVFQISQIVKIDQEEIVNSLSKCVFIQITHNNEIMFISDAHRRFVSDKLYSRKNKVEISLINFLESKPFEKTSVQYLPELYKRANQFDALRKLINPDYIVKTLQTEHDIDLLIKNSKLVADVAYENNDWNILISYSIISSLLNTLASRTVGEEEIDALLSLNDHQNSINRAYLAVLPEDRLQMLSKICYDIKKKGGSLPDGVISDIEDLVSLIKPSITSRDKIIEIAVNLFHINPDAASRLLAKLGAIVDGRLMDVMLAVISVRLGDEPDSADTLRSMISNDSVKDFARVSSPVIARMDSEQIISEVNQTNDVSAKLFLLRSWCNSNRDNSKSLKVVEYALEIMTSSVDYSPSMRHLRQISEPLLACEGEKVFEAISRIDILKNTSLISPFDEKVRLELLLATIEEKNGIKLGVNRLYETYCSLDQISDLDVRCYCLSRFLISLPHIQPEDNVTLSEIEGRLRNEFSLLVKNSADQFNITKRIIRATTSVSPELARDFADKLNTIINRDKAFFEIIKVYIDNFSENIQLGFLEGIIEKISEKEKRDWANVVILEMLAEKNSLSSFFENRDIKKDISQFIDPQDQCFAYSFLVKHFSQLGNKEKAEDFLKALMNAWNMIDVLWSKLEIGFNILSIIGESVREFSNDFYKELSLIRSSTPFADKTIADVFINIVRLMIRSLPDVLKSKDYSDHLSNLKKVIRLIPSFSVQTLLMGEIALQLFIFEKQTEGETFVRENVLNCLEGVLDNEQRSRTIIRIAPVLFLYERTLLENEIENLSRSKKEKALVRIIHYLVSKRDPDDPIDYENLNFELDYKKALQACDVIKSLQTDALISSSIDLVINLICKKDRDKNIQERCTLIDRQALTIGKEISEIIKKLPDQENIFHNGYKLVCQASLVRLRAAATRNNSRASTEWKKIVPSANELIEFIEKIPNIADRAFVMAEAGSRIYLEDIKQGHYLLENCKNLIYQIDNINDRSERFYILANAWKAIDDDQSSIMFLKEAFTISSMLSWDSSKDEVTSRILELAHSIDPEFASSLTSSIDNPVVQDKFRKSLEEKDLQSKPNNLKLGRSDIEIKRLLDNAAYRLLRSFCSGRGYAQSENVVCDWLIHCKDFPLQDAYNVYSWSIENNLAMNQKISTPQLEVLFGNITENLLLIKRIGDALTIAETNRNINPLLASDIETDLELYSAESAIRNTMEKWISDNSGESIKIYDAYFSQKDLTILKSINPSSRVDIFTLWKTQKGLSVGDHDIELRYKSKWKDISDQSPPETHIYIVGIRSNGDGPIHDRFVISDDKGVSLGTSIGGLGKKDSSVHYLDRDEILKIEQTYINPLLLGNYRVYKDEKLETFSFTL